MSSRSVLRAFAILLALTAAGALVFWATLPGRLPTDDDWRAVNAHVAAHHAPGDAIVIAPAWATRGRDFLTAAPVYTWQDYLNGELVSASRLWLVTLPRVPRFDRDDVVNALAGASSNRGDPLDVGTLTVERFTPSRPVPLWRLSEQVMKAQVRLGGAKPQPCPVRGDRFQCARGPWNVVHAAWLEVDEQPMRCVWAHPVDGAPLEITIDDVPAGSVLEGRGALVRQAPALKAESVELVVKWNGERIGEQTFANRFGRQPFSMALPDSTSPGRLTFEISARNAWRREFCLDAWVLPSP